jgi:glycosyltransferase involved in cell wall biosynthesis
MAHKSERLAILVAFSGTGGVERMILNLLHGFSAYDIQVDLLAIVREGWRTFSAALPNVRVIDLGVRHTSLVVPAVADYLRRERPDAILAVRDRAIRAALLARRLSGRRVNLVGNLHTNLSAALEKKSPLLRWLRCQPMRWMYPGVDRIIAVSDGVAQDILKITGLPRDWVEAIPNPVIGADLFARSRQAPAHPWFADQGPPIILGSGRLTGQKDFATLIRAFALVRAQRECRLMILGEGGLRTQLEELVDELRLGPSVSMPGFIDNPYPSMARSSLFVLSSIWEGSPTVLTEALALGVPVVSTDCPSGPRETLAGGRYGRLVPMGDPQHLAEAMLETLSHPPDPAVLRGAVQAFTIERSARRYLDALGFENCGPVPCGSLS